MNCYFVYNEQSIYYLITIIISTITYIYIYIYIYIFYIYLFTYFYSYVCWMTFNLSLHSLMDLM